MEVFFYSIAAYLLLGAIGMAVANKKATAIVRQQRWLKYGTYVLITATVLTSIFFNYLHGLVLVIFAFGLYEILLTAFRKTNKSYVTIALIFFAILSYGLWRFAMVFTNTFQLFIYMQVLLFDAFSQIAGQLFGKRQLVSKVSPAKTVEGVLGGLAFCIFSSFILSHWLYLHLFPAMILALITAVSSFAGDLLASYYKRKMQLKDYSNLLPGQGGFLDRFDSLLMTGFVYFLLHQFNFFALLFGEETIVHVIVQ